VTRRPSAQNEKLDRSRSVYGGEGKRGCGLRAKKRKEKREKAEARLCGRENVADVREEGDELS